MEATSSDSSPSSTTTRSTRAAGRMAVLAGVALIRVLIGCQPHSGQDNYHGLHAAYGGDFEAQRHWMELTWHLPIGQWYWYDLYYWGLDYPPLSAYLSWICAYFSSRWVGPETVALETSRGWEDPTHKAYMRGTVLVTDLLVYGTVAWLWTNRRYLFTSSATTVSSSSSTKRDAGLALSSVVWWVVVMSQPAILLIDHGHFQYNTTALGLSLWGFYYMTEPTLRSCVLGSIFFCLALSFKQMTLYYALAVFAYLLGRCGAEGRRSFLPRVVALGVTVVSCFGLLWWPFVVYGPEGTTPWQRAHHVLRRIIPLQRGLFEGKVANLWCALSVKPLRLRQRIPSRWQPTAALVLTLILLVPCCYRLFRIGCQLLPQQQLYDQRNHRRLLLWGTASSALAFFLASFQVHEKSILLALAPLSLLRPEDSTLVDWFSIVSTWTLWPLLVLDRLQVAYVCTLLLFVTLLQGTRVIDQQMAMDSGTLTAAPSRGFFEQALGGYLRWIPTGSYVIMGLLHVAEAVWTPPAHLPDLFPVLWSIVGCALFGLAWSATCWHLYSTTPLPGATKVKAL